MRLNSRTHSGLQAGELSRLLSAAVVNRNFCNLLLTDPETALAAGYLGEPFHLDIYEKTWITSIRARSLAEFASHFVANRNGSDNQNAACD